MNKVCLLTGIRILMVDDHAVVRSSLSLMLASQGAIIVGEVATGMQAIQLAQELQPDIILMDINLPDIDGIEATRQICSIWPEAKIIALTVYDEKAYLLPYLEAGGCGFVCKASTDQEVFHAIQAAVRGESYISKQGIEILLRRRSDSDRQTMAPSPEMLSPRELVVLQLIARGYTSREIGNRLSISPHTVDTYRSRIMRKLHLNNRHEVVDYAIRHRILGNINIRNHQTHTPVMIFLTKGDHFS